MTDHESETFDAKVSEFDADMRQVLLGLRVALIASWNTLSLSGQNSEALSQAISAINRVLDE